MARGDLTTRLTLVELAKRTNNKQLLEIAEVLSETLPVVENAPWYEANQKVSHLHNRRAAIPEGTWRAVNEGIGSTSSQTEQYVEPIGLLEARSEIDEYEVSIAPNPKQFMNQENLAFIEGMSQQIEDAFFYGSRASTPNGIDGLVTRYSDLSLENVYDCGDSTGSSVTSAYIVQWGPKGVYLVYPRGSKTAGVQAKYLGKMLVTDGGGSNQFLAHVTQFKFNLGIVIRDNRSVQRIANIGTTTANHFDEDLAIKALNRMPRKAKGAVIYVGPTVKDQLDIYAKDKTNVHYTIENVFGKEVTFFRGVPVKKCDAIKDTESVVT
jgi:hypothetical protein